MTMAPGARPSTQPSEPKSRLSTCAALTTTSIRRSAPSTASCAEAWTGSPRASRRSARRSTPTTGRPARRSERAIPSPIAPSPTTTIFSNVSDTAPPLLPSLVLWLFPGGRSQQLGAFREKLAADQPATDLAGTGADLVKLGVPQQAARRIVVDVAVAAQDLDGVEGQLGRLLGCIEDGPGRVL